MVVKSLDIRKQVERGISVLRAGGILAFPTDTVYGLKIIPKVIGEDFIMDHEKMDDIILDLEYQE